MRKGIKILGIGSLLFSLLACSSNSIRDNGYELTLLHVNDMHGRVVEGKYDGVGMARISTIAKELKKDKNNGKVLLLDAGDTFHGTTFATLTKGKSIVEIMNDIPFNYATLGNHDFNYGRERLEELIDIAKYKILAANVYDKETNKPLVQRYDVIKIDGKKVGFFGLSTPETYYKTNPLNVETLVFKEPIEVAKDVVKSMKEQGVEFIVAICHLGDDESTELKYQSIGLAQEVPEINLIVDGHSHTVLDSKKIVNGVTIVQTGEYNKNVGVVKIDLDKIGEESAINYSLMKKEDILNGKNPVVEDEKIKKKIEKISDEQKKITEKIIGNTPVFLQGDREYVRTGETNLAQLITDAMLWKTKADVAITNGGGIRTSIKEGDIKIGDVISVLPFGNYVVTKEITGEQILLALENGLRAYPNSLGGMAQFAGMKVIIDKTKPEFERVLAVEINGEPLEKDRVYVVATNDFMSAGGDGYSSLKNGKILGNFSGLDEILIKYIQKVGIKNREIPENRLIVK